jgi:hypothetical protein
MCMHWEITTTIKLPHVIFIYLFIVFDGKNLSKAFQENEIVMVNLDYQD